MEGSRVSLGKQGAAVSGMVVLGDLQLQDFWETEVKDELLSEQEEICSACVEFGDPVGSCGVVGGGREESRCWKLSLHTQVRACGAG